MHLHPHRWPHRPHPRRVRPGGDPSGRRPSRAGRRPRRRGLHPAHRAARGGRGHRRPRRHRRHHRGGHRLVLTDAAAASRRPPSSTPGAKGGLRRWTTRGFGAITAWSGTCWQVERLADHIAVAAPRLRRPGAPVFLDIPMDVQFDMVEETAVSWPVDIGRPSRAGSTRARSIRSSLCSPIARPMVFAGVVRGPRRGGLIEVVERCRRYVPQQPGQGSLPYGHPLLGNHARSLAFSGATRAGAGVDWDFRTGYGTRSGRGGCHPGRRRPREGGLESAAQIGVVADPAQ